MKSIQNIFCCDFCFSCDNFCFSYENQDDSPTIDEIVEACTF